MLGAALLRAEVPALGVALFWVLCFRRAPLALRWLFGCFVGHVLFWLYATQVPRFLAPVYALGVWFGAAAIWQGGSWLARRLHPDRADGPSRRWIQALALLGCLCLVLAEGMRAADRLTHWKEELEQRPGAPLFAHAERLRARFGDRLFQVGFENGVYFFPGLVIGDWFGPGRYRQVIEDAPVRRMGSPAVVRVQMERLGCRLLLINTETFPLDLDAYRAEFTLEKRTRQGVLLTLK